MGIGGSQILIIGIVLVILFIAPSRLPGLGKSLAQAIRGFKKGISSDDEMDVTDSVTQEKIDANDSQNVKSTQTEKDKV